MGRCNAILTAAILLLFLLHGILGSFQLLGAGNTAVKAAAWASGVSAQPRKTKPVRRGCVPVTVMSVSMVFFWGIGAPVPPFAS